MIDYEAKQILSNAILNVVNNSPSNLQMTYNNISLEQFNIWIQYVFNTLNIMGEYIPMHMYQYIYNQIQIIINSTDDTYYNKIYKINQILLDFGKQILKL